MAKPAEVLMSDASCDLLSGRDMIARWYGWTRGQCDAAIVAGIVLTFRLPHRRTIYALKSENAAHWKAAADAHRARNGRQPDHRTADSGRTGPDDADERDRNAVRGGEGKEADGRGAPP